MAVRECLFCPNPADSKEHLLSDWIVKSLGKQPMVRHTIDKSPPKEFHGALQVKCVCSECNGGWMSALEVRVKPCIGLLMHDVSLTLTTEQQEAISTWAVKTAMVLEATRRDRPRCYTRTECEQLRLNSAIPGRSMIWLGRFSGSGLSAAGTDIWLDIDKVPRAAHGCVTTVIIGHLAVQVLTVHFPSQYDGKRMEMKCKGGPWNELLIDIWPASTRVGWPPRMTFTQGGPTPFTTLRDRWRLGRSPSLRLDPTPYTPVFSTPVRSGRQP